LLNMSALAGTPVTHYSWGIEVTGLAWKQIGADFRNPINGPHHAILAQRPSISDPDRTFIPTSPHDHFMGRICRSMREFRWPLWICIARLLCRL